MKEIVKKRIHTNQVIFVLGFVAVLTSGFFGTTDNYSGVVAKSEFIYSKRDVSFPSCHASTIAETHDGLVVAWFGGKHEKSKDVGIWISRNLNGKWTKPFEAANGVQNDTLRYPTWNPVLFYDKGKLLLFYKIGPSPSSWWGEMKNSRDNGKSWSVSTRLPDQIWGPVKNKPVLLENGRLLCPSSSENKGWRVHMEWTPDFGKTWQRTPELNSGDTLPAIQPTILKHAGGKLQILCRTKRDRIYTAWSYDNGETWTKLEPTSLPNNNSGIDAVTLNDGRHLLVYNHLDLKKNKGDRNKLNLAVSDDGINWKAVTYLENDPSTESEYSYPAIIQSSDGLVHITYTWNRKLIKHVVVNPEKINSEPITNGIWPL
jgi:predicted neuraminidase